MSFNQKHIDALSIKMPDNCNAGKNLTIRDYFFTLLKMLWEDGEGFSGKRPFGNSGWELGIFVALVKNGVIGGSFDSYGDLLDYSPAGYSFVHDMIEAAFYGH